MSGIREGIRRAGMLLAAALLARIPITIFPVFFVIQSQAEFGRYDVGGYTVLTFSVGATINGLASGWFFSRFRHSLIAMITGGLTTALLLASAAPNNSMARVLILGGLLGLCFPPLHIGSRALYPKLLDERRLLRFYSLDVSLIQITWIIAPVAVVAGAGIIGIQNIYLILAVITAAGSAWYVYVSRNLSQPIPSAKVEKSRRLDLSLLTDRRLHIYLLVASALMFTSGLILPVIVAHSGATSQQSMAILVWSLGSALGSFLVNRGSVRPLRLAGLMACSIVALIVAILLGGMVLTDIALFLLGFASAPVSAAVFYFVSQHFRIRHQSFVFGMITSTQIIAEGIGTSISGILLDLSATPWIWGLILVTLSAVLVVLALNTRRAFTHMPVPRTGIIPIITQNFTK